MKRLFFALTLAVLFGSQAAHGYAMPYDMQPGGPDGGLYQGAWGWFFGFKEKGGRFQLMPMCEAAEGATRSRWLGKGAEIECNRHTSLPERTTTLAWGRERVPVCRWISPLDGEVFIKYSLVSAGSLPKGAPVRLTVSGKDAEMSDMSAPEKRPEGQPAFHREVLRGHNNNWFAVKVRKGSVLDFSFDFPGEAPKQGEIKVRIGLQPVEYNAFEDLFRAGDKARKEQETRQPMPWETDEKRAQVNAAPLQLLAHKGQAE